MRSLLSVLAATLVVVAGSGCSNDGDDSTAAESTAGTTTASTSASTSAGATTAPPATTESGGRPEPPADQSRWAAQVDGACKPWQQRIDGVDPPADASGLERWLDDLLPLVRKQVGAVAAVKPPAKQSEAEKAALFTENLKKLERSLTRYVAAIRANDTEAVQRALLEANAAGAASRGYALSLDVTQCGGYAGG